MLALQNIPKAELIDIDNILHDSAPMILDWRAEDEHIISYLGEQITKHQVAELGYQVLNTIPGMVFETSGYVWRVNGQNRLTAQSILTGNDITDYDLIYFASDMLFIGEVKMTNPHRFMDTEIRDALNTSVIRRKLMPICELFKISESEVCWVTFVFSDVLDKLMSAERLVIDKYNKAGYMIGVLPFAREYIDTVVKALKNS